MHIFLVCVVFDLSAIEKTQNLNCYGKTVRMFFAYR